MLHSRKEGFKLLVNVYFFIKESASGSLWPLKIKIHIAKMLLACIGSFSNQSFIKMTKHVFDGQLHILIKHKIVYWKYLLIRY